MERGRHRGNHRERGGGQQRHVAVTGGKRCGDAHRCPLQPAPQTQPPLPHQRRLCCARLRLPLWPPGVPQSVHHQSCPYCREPGRRQPPPAPACEAAAPARSTSSTTRTASYRRTACGSPAAAAARRWPPLPLLRGRRRAGGGTSTAGAPACGPGAMLRRLGAWSCRWKWRREWEGCRRRWLMQLPGRKRWGQPLRRRQWCRDQAPRRRCCCWERQ